MRGHGMAWRVLLISLAVVALASCGRKGAVDGQGPSTDAARAVTTASGLQYEDLVVGTGQQAQAGDAVTVHYTGWLTSGKKFDSSVDRGEPFQFYLGQGEVIRGWDEGVTGMRVGGKRRLTIPARLGYGARGTRNIPPNSTLIFEVELLGVQ